MTASGKSSFTVQRLEPEGWVDLSVVDTWEAVLMEVAFHDGNDDLIDWGWIVAGSPSMIVHSRKDGRWRIIQRPSPGETFTA